MPRCRSAARPPPWSDEITSCWRHGGFGRYRMVLVWCQRMTSTDAADGRIVGSLPQAVLLVREHAHTAVVILHMGPLTPAPLLQPRAADTSLEV